MSRWTYVNGRYARRGSAVVSVLDRGFQFADGVYEVWAVRDGRLLDAAPHFDRLDRSLAELRIAPPMTRAALESVMEEVRRRNHVRDGIVYVQVSRGVASRGHAFPAPAPARTLVVSATRIDPAAYAERLKTGVRVISHPDERWARCDVKSTALIANVLAKQAAAAAGAMEAWLVDDAGQVTEGAASTAWIVGVDGQLVTRSTRDNILPGITRAAIVDTARERQIRVEERPFTLEEAKAAREAFFTGAGSMVTPVVAIDGAPVGDGAPGPVTLGLARAFLDARVGHA